MKKVFFALLIASASLASCVKDYNCVCVKTDGPRSASETTMLRNTKKGAEENCDNGDSVMGTVVTECEIQ